MHLVIVSPFPPTITGIGQYGYHLTRTFANSKAFSRITVLAGSYSTGQIPNHLGTTKLDYCWVPGQLQSAPIILHRIRRLNPDLIWFNLGATVFGRSPLNNLLGMLTPLITRAFGFPTIVTMHEMPELTDLRTLRAPGGVFAKVGAKILTQLIKQTAVLCLTMQHYTDW